LILIDERRARRYAKEESLEVIGCVGILETLHRRGLPTFATHTRNFSIALSDRQTRATGKSREIEAVAVVGAQPKSLTGVSIPGPTGYFRGLWTDRS
jgi:hypothetical protein